jgi:hypothetical protein
LANDRGSIHDGSVRFFVIVALATACSDGVGLDAGSDASVDLDAEAELDGGTIHSACTRWCAAESSCLFTRNVEWLERNHASATCAFRDPAATTAECLAQCQRGIDTMNKLLVGCLECTSSALETACGAEPSCGDCHDIPTFMGTLEFDERRQFACWLSDEPAPGPPPCAYGPRDPDLSLPIEESYEGTAVVLSSADLLLANGSTLTLDGADLEFPALVVASTISVSLASNCPFWCDHSITLRDLAGELLFVAWDLKSSPLPEVPELSLDYEAAVCASLNGPCYQEIPGDILVTLPGTAPTHIAAGTEQELGPFVVVNGRSASLFDIFCSDTPGWRSTGYALRR